jgi:hypothetical protein
MSLASTSAMEDASRGRRSLTASRFFRRKGAVVKRVKKELSRSVDPCE